MVVTDPAAPAGVVHAVRAALRAGTPAVQLRWKEGRTRDLLELGRALRDATAAAGALLIVNDRVDIALAVGADGAHLGDDDLPLPAARGIVPAGFLLGRSVDTPAEAEAAERGGADYVGVGPVFPTGTKLDTGPVIGSVGIRAVRASVSLPILAIGGIGVETAAEVTRAGADGVAVIGAVMGRSDPESAAGELLRQVAEGRRG